MGSTGEGSENITLIRGGGQARGKEENNLNERLCPKDPAHVDSFSRELNFPAFGSP